jgi:two-component system, OmpR family, phosphate regulon sensor histidine kinase PhoR
MSFLISLDVMEGGMGSNKKETCVPEDFLAHLIHDLKAPVVTIGGFARRLLEGKMGDVTPEQKEGLTIILKSCERLEHDLKMVLQHMKMDLAEGLSPQVLDVITTAERVCEALKPEADAKQVSLNVQAPPERVSVEADPFIINKAIFNLVDNAIRYTDEGGQIQVSISLQNDFVDIAVTDDGKGIEKEKLALVLQPFEEVIGVQDRELRGLGLGLSNVKRYAELHGGVLEANCTPGKGSEFTIRIPRHFKETKKEEV